LLSGDLQIITPLRKGEAGVNELNRALQELLNPAKEGKREINAFSTIFREGDKVMQTKNSYATTWEHMLTKYVGEGVYNGDIGFIESVESEAGIVRIVFDGDRMTQIPVKALQDVALAYAITIHKAQGSEFDTVIVPIMATNPEFMTRNLLYTAVTRAKKRVIIIGEEYVMERMIRNNKSINRMSGLREKLSASMHENNRTLDNVYRDVQ
jgi:exodeoxyribonuclease V alpha subunit